MASLFYFNRFWSTSKDRPATPLQDQDAEKGAIPSTKARVQELFCLAPHKNLRYPGVPPLKPLHIPLFNKPKDEPDSPIPEEIEISFEDCSDDQTMVADNMIRNDEHGFPQQKSSDKPDNVDFGNRSRGDEKNNIFDFHAEAFPTSPAGVEDINTDGAFATFGEEFNPFRLESNFDAAKVAEPTSSTPESDMEVAGVLEDLLKSEKPRGIVVKRSPSKRKGSKPSARAATSLSADDKIQPTKTESNNSPNVTKGEGSSSRIRFEDAITPKLRLYIDDYDSAFFEKLMSDLIGQPIVTKLVMQRSGLNDLKRKRTPKEMSLFFRMVQSLPNLKTLILKNMDSENSDMEQFHEAVYAHPKLQLLQLHLANGGVDALTLRTLTTIPNLTDVTFETTKSCDFTLLLRSNSLRKLHVICNDTYKFDNAHLMSLVQMLEKNNSLQELVLEPQMSFTAFKFLAYALRVNRSLRIFRVSIQESPSEALVDQAVSEICTVLTTNTVLKTLHNMSYQSIQVSMESRRKLLKALEASQSLSHFVFFDEDASFAGQKVSFIGNPDNSTVNTGLDTTGISENDSTYVSTIGTETTYSGTGEMYLDDDLPENLTACTCGAIDKASLDSYIKETQKLIKGTAAKSRKVGSAVRKFFDKKLEELTDTDGQSTYTGASYAGTNRTDDLATLETRDSENTLQTRNNSVSVKSVN